MLILLCSLCVLFASNLYVKNNDDKLSISYKIKSNLRSDECMKEGDSILKQEEMSDIKIPYGDITDEEASLFIENIFFSMRYFPLAETVNEDGMKGWVYYIDSDYANPVEFKKYCLQFMNEETFDYFFRIFEYEIYDDLVIRNTESELSKYVIDNSGERKFQTINRTENMLQLKIPFIYSGMSDVEPKEDYGEVWLEKQSSGEWKIIRISQWLNDLTVYEFKEFANIFLIKSESDFEQFLNKYGKDNKGERISTQIIRNGAYILPESDKKMLTESDLQSLTKLSATLAFYEIEARHGYVSEWEDSFISFYLYFAYHCPWFSRWPENQKELTDIEKENQEILQKYIKSF